MIQKKVILTLATVALLPITARTTYAETLSISGNGDGSVSTMSVNQSQINTVQQTNTAEVSNNTNVQADTGNNTASSNTGNAAVQTGDANVTSTIENTANQSVATNTTCCNGTGSSGSITGNGADTTNSINYSANNTNVTTVYQNATIRNEVNGSANTGGNNANYNNGNVTISTGSINVKDSITNNVNHSAVAIATGGKNDFSIKISGNGAGSVNTITLNQDSNAVVTVNNVADIFNQSIWNLLTGNNSANGNNGDVTIKTGDIALQVAVSNSVNTSTVKVECDCETTPPPPPPCEGNGCNPPPPPPPSNGGGGGTTTSGGNGSSSGGGSSPAGSVLGLTTGEILPATGNPWILLAILGNLLMLFFGLVLRLRSGRSPGFAYAI